MSAATVDTTLIATIRRTLAEAAEPGRAPAMQAYMKSTLPYYGVSLPLMRATMRPVLSAHRLPDRATWEATLRSLWDGATHREERYVALELAGHRFYRDFQRPDAVGGLYRHLIVTGAWWDLVDNVAPGLIGPILAREPREADRMRAWAIADDMWLRRAAIICQLSAKDATDTALLTDAIDANTLGTRFANEFLHPQGDRLVAPPACADGSGLGETLRRGPHRPPRAAQRPRGHEAPGLAATRAAPPHT